MGFFSSCCKHCGKEVLAPCPPTKWSEAVAILKDNSMFIGQYDGYGRISGAELYDHGEPEMYHHHCWVEAGEPMGFSGPSKHANGQGYFIDPTVLEREYPIEGGWRFAENCTSCDGYGYIFVEENDESSGPCPRCAGKGFLEFDAYGNPI